MTSGNCTRCDKPHQRDNGCEECGSFFDAADAMNRELVGALISQEFHKALHAPRPCLMHVSRVEEVHTTTHTYDDQGRTLSIGSETLPKDVCIRCGAKIDEGT